MSGFVPYHKKKKREPAEGDGARLFSTGSRLSEKGQKSNNLKAYVLLMGN